MKYQYIYFISYLAVLAFNKSSEIYKDAVFVSPFLRSFDIVPSSATPIRLSFSSKMKL